MHIWVDADACPRVIREILFRAATRTATPLTLVANQMIATPPSPWIRALQVPMGFDVADAEIARRAAPGDLVITADIPLAAQVIDRGARVLDPRGEGMTEENIRERLSMRDFMQGLRDSGIETGGPAGFSAADSRAFAAALDRQLALRQI
jgi:uncharacterized protein YaiI (UPF0178 family)